MLVTVFSPELQSESLKLAAELRRVGFNVTCYPEPVKLQKQFKFADRMGIRTVLVLGPDEAAEGNVTVKSLSIGSQQVIRRGEVPQLLQRILEG